MGFQAQGRCEAHLGAAAAPGEHLQQLEAAPAPPAALTEQKIPQIAAFFLGSGIGAEGKVGFVRSRFCNQILAPIPRGLSQFQEKPWDGTLPNSRVFPFTGP